jgi:hypothetical protein
MNLQNFAGGKHLARDFTLQRVVAYDFLDTLMAGSYRVEPICIQATVRTRSHSCDA